MILVWYWGTGLGGPRLVGPRVRGAPGWGAWLGSLGWGTVLSFGCSPAENYGGLGLFETMSKLILGPNLIIFWYLE